MNKMPVLFVGHGSPMNALDAENPFNQGFRRIAQKFAKPKAILMISAHWYGNRLQVTSGERPEMIYDFYGFPAALSQVQYPAPGSPELAEQVRSLLQPENVETNPERGFDHGAWAVLKHLYPEADIPVVQLSLNLMQPAQWHFDLAKKLTPLREQGVLVVGSGKVALQHAVRGVGNDGELHLGHGAVGGKYGIERGVFGLFRPPAAASAFGCGRNRRGSCRSGFTSPTTSGRCPCLCRGRSRTGCSFRPAVRGNGCCVSRLHPPP